MKAKQIKEARVICGLSRPIEERATLLSVMARAIALRCVDLWI